MGVLVLLAGKCAIIPCETQIEVISSQIPEFVLDGNKMQADFTIKNIGDVTAEKCIITWRVGEDQQFSNEFQLAPLEEKQVQMQSQEIQRRDDSEPSWWWVSCDNTETSKIHNNIKVQNS